MSLREIANEQNNLEQIQIQLTQIQNSITELKNSSTNSDNSQTTSLIFSELRTLLKQLNEESKNNANSIYSELKNSVNSIYSELKSNVNKTNETLEKNIETTADEISKKTIKNINAIEQDLISAKKSFLETIKEGKKEVEKAINEERRAIFKSWSNVLFFIAVGALCVFLGVFVINFFSVKKELVQDLATEQIKRAAVKEYKKTLTEEPKGIIELKELELQWASNEKNVRWKDKEKTLNSFKKDIEWAKKLQE